MTQVSITLKQAAGLVSRVEAWLAEWRRFAWEVQAQAELERQLKGVDAHLLRDMGLTWTGRRLERIVGDDSP